MVDLGKKLIDIFNANQGHSAFRAMVRRMKDNGIKLSYINDKNEGPAYFDGERVVVNFFYPESVIKTALDHEVSHANARTTRRVFDSEKTLNYQSYFAIGLMDEVHAFSNQCEFAIQRYLEKLRAGNADGSPEEKAFEGFFGGISQFRGPYVYGLLGQEFKLNSPQQVQDAVKFYFYNKVMLGSDSPADFVAGRKAVLKAFFQKQTSQLMPINNPVLDAYVNSEIQYGRDNIEAFSAQKRNKKITLESATHIFRTGDGVFLTSDDYEEVLGVSTVDQLVDMATQSSRHLGAFHNVFIEIGERKTGRRHSTAAQNEYVHS